MFGSAKTPVTRGQAIVIILVILHLLVFGVVLNPEKSIQFSLVSVTCLYLIQAIYNGSMTVVGALFGARRVSDEDALAALKDADLPMYVVLLPVYKEAEIASKLITNVGQIRYGHTTVAENYNNVEVIVLVEEKDLDTQQAIKQSGATWLNMVVVPHQYKDFPKTKPRAMRYWLDTNGDQYPDETLVVVYDAEDNPDQLQFGRVLHTFRKMSENVAVVQCQLSFQKGSGENWLTRLFSIEYATYFRLVLPALDRLRLFVPLGGTSNHFRLDILRQVGGWDPYNVTEDCALGAELNVHGYRTAVVQSITEEDPTFSVARWVYQRARWIKGFVQTWFVVNRSPIAALRVMGLWRWAGFQIHVGINTLLMFFTPIMWVLLAKQAIDPSPEIARLIPNTLERAMLASMLAGNGLAFLMQAIGSLKQGTVKYLPFLALLPIYWLIMSWATWRAFYEFINEPHKWNKTDHARTATATKKRRFAVALRGLRLLVVVLAVLFSAQPVLAQEEQRSTTTQHSQCANSVNVMVYGADEWRWDHYDRFFTQLEELSDGERPVDCLSIVFPIYVDSWSGTKLSRGPETPSDRELQEFTQEAHQRGYTVQWKPLLDEASLGGKWRGAVMPGGDLNPDSVALWFESYAEILSEYAELAENLNVEVLMAGTEMASLDQDQPKYNDGWNLVIERVREVFSGQVTYGVNWNPRAHVPGFIDLLDYLSVSAYYPVDADTGSSVEELVAAWHRSAGYDLAVLQATGVPLVFSEVGMASNAEAWRAPWVTPKSGYSESDQAAYYAAMCQIATQNNIGLQWWKIDFYTLEPDEAHPMSPWGKKAWDVVTNCDPTNGESSREDLQKV